MSRTNTHYDLLGLSQSATDEVVRAAYRALTKTLHPDRGGDPAKMAAVNDAYATLSDPARRRDYDRTLGANAGADATPNKPQTNTRPNTRPNTSDSWAAGDWTQKQTPPTTTAPPAEEEPTSQQASRGDAPLTAWLLQVAAAGGLALLAAGVLVGAIVGGLIEHYSWKHIALNVLIVLALTATTLYAVSRRIRQRGQRPDKLYLGLVAVIGLVGILSRHDIFGWAAIAWAALTVALAESDVWLGRTGNGFTDSWARADGSRREE